MLHHFVKALYDELLVSPLSPCRLGNYLQYSFFIDPVFKFMKDNGFLLITEQSGVLHIKVELHPRLHLVHVLTTAAAAAAGLESKFGAKIY